MIHSMRFLTERYYTAIKEAYNSKAGKVSQPTLLFRFDFRNLRIQPRGDGTEVRCTKDPQQLQVRR